MKNRFVLAVVIAFAGLLIFFLVMSPGRRSAGSNGKEGPTKISSGGTTNGGAPARPARNETEKERRERLMSNSNKTYRDDFKLSEQDVYLYVQSKGSNALSLVSAFESTRDKDYLKAAAEKFPNDPFVQAKVLMWLDLSEEERTKWTEAFKKSSPTNAFANFLAAREAVKQGDTPKALAEVMAAKGKSYDEFDRESAEGLGEAYLSTGRSAAEAKTLGMAEVTLPQLAEFKKMGRQFVDLAEKSAATGDTKTQQEMLAANWQIGDRMRSGESSSTLITELVGIAIENLTLRSWPAGVDFDGRSTADLLAANNAEAKSLKSGTPVFEKWFPTAPDDEIVTYMDTMLALGERQALDWLKERHPEFAQVEPLKN